MDIMPDASTLAGRAPSLREALFVPAEHSILLSGAPGLRGKQGEVSWRLFWPPSFSPDHGLGDHTFIKELMTAPAGLIHMVGLSSRGLYTPIVSHTYLNTSVEHDMLLLFQKKAPVKLR